MKKFADYFRERSDLELSLIGAIYVLSVVDVVLRGIIYLLG